MLTPVLPNRSTIDPGGRDATPDGQDGSLDPYAQCARELDRLPSLSAAEQAALLEEVARFGPVVRVGRRLQRLVPADRRPEYDAVRNCLLLGNLRFARSVIRRCGYRPGSLDWTDLIQESVFGLSRAIELFDAARHEQFSSYAYQWIRLSVRRAILSQGHVIRIPPYVVERPTRPARRLPRAKSADLGRRCRGCPDPKQPTPLQALLSDEARPALRAAFERYFRRMPDRTGDVLKLRVGWDDGRERTLREIGERYGLTRERIRQIESHGMEKLAWMDGRTRVVELAFQ